MMKSWADHCSSDEDTDDNISVESEEQDNPESFDAAFSEKVRIDDHNEVPDEVKPGQKVRTYDFPDRPPFTAFVGNLSYDIKESSQLQQALADVVFDRLGERVNVLGGRISYDRDGRNTQHRGFGYVELETLEELKTVMKLNDDEQAMLAGRKMQVDTANDHNRPNNNFQRRGQHRGSFDRHSNARPQSNEPREKIDGSKFRGGKFNNNSNNNSNNNNNNNYRNNRSNNINGLASGDAARQRPSLKLAPRSKPVNGSDRSSSSNIFGGAKARDAQAWEKGRQQQHQDQHASGGDEKKKTTPSSKKGAEDNSSNDNNNKTFVKDSKTDYKDRRQSGRGGGRGAKGRGNHRGGNNNSGRGDQNNQNNRRGSGRRNLQQQNDKKVDKRQQQTSPEEKAAATTAKTNTKITPSNPEPKAPKNKFALLNFESDSD